MPKIGRRYAVPADATEQLVSTHPLIVRRRVIWGECDPAGVVYTPRFCDYAASAADFWFRHVLGHSDRPDPARKQIVFPMRAMQFTFTAMLAADDVFDMRVDLAKVSARTLTLVIAATRSDDVGTFSATLTRVAFDQSIGGGTSIPDLLRERLFTMLLKPHSQ